MNANLDEALALCDQANGLQPGRRPYYLDTRGSVLLRQGRLTEAAETFTRALAATNDRQPALRETIRQHLAQTQAGKVK